MLSVAADTKILISFGARRGGIDFAISLRHDIYKKYGKNPAADPCLCYIDAESLRGDANTKYTWDAKLQNAVMANPNWKSHYELAMSSCKTMVLLITSEWLKSPFCWEELTMLQRIAAERNGRIKVVLVIWPDALEFMQSGSLLDRTGKMRFASVLWASLVKIPSAVSIPVSGGSAPGFALIESTGGVNEFAYACSETECRAIIAATTIE